MRRPVVPGWAKEQHLRLFYVLKGTTIIKRAQSEKPNPRCKEGVRSCSRHKHRAFKMKKNKIFKCILIVGSLIISNTTYAQDRKQMTIEVGYNALTFDDVKLTGSYGLSYTTLPWELIGNLYAGIHLSPFNFNFGLVDKDSTSDIIRLGPAIGYYFTPTIFVALPVAVVCEVYSQDHNTKTAWGMSWAPSIYAGSNKFGIFAGPMFTISFEGDSKVSTGFRAGLYF